MKCPACETPCEPEHEAEPDINVGVGRYHCTSCDWSEPDDDAAPKWCLVRIEALEANVERLGFVVKSAIAWRDTWRHRTPFGEEAKAVALVDEVDNFLGIGAPIRRSP